ncbi:MAG: response regulator [Flavobacteriales bacterium]|jgi:CheY-like chemotaxis protein|nr:response regulator [Flavobacteriales bacterium]MBT3963814.1 response regulator [Flavobacteriales bacterium]MBT4705405.1 response regulator [Flavobacteriales bacterium]MBT4929844.1 response regulator [Flavobacteriales bacterium]MBT5132218.1 response regulator [Flavobacteriales bacterium]
MMTLSYDLILLDVQMPAMSGLEVVEQLRNEGIVTPIVMSSANVLSSAISEAIELGANDYLTKPFSLDKFQEMVNKYTDLSVSRA